MSSSPRGATGAFASAERRTYENLAHGRDNNFNLTRMLAASAVIVSHSYALPMGSWKEPFSEYGFTLGGLAVSAFFALSGFLISASFERRPSLIEFGIARALRILPALAVVTILTVLVLGPLVTRLPIADYFHDRQTWLYVPKALSLRWMAFSLPGVFDTLRYQVVNGSLWTLYYEVTCYVGLALACRIEMMVRVPRWLIFALYALVYVVLLHSSGRHHADAIVYAQLSLPFVLGMAAYRSRRYLPANAAISALLVLLAVAALFLDVLAFEIRMLAVAYAALYLAQIPSPLLLEYNRLGDYSYGVYIYGWPIQQLILRQYPAMHPVLLIALTLPAAILCGIVSWHFVEKPALAGKKRAPAAGTGLLQPFAHR